jgi:hypothetical protein
VYNSSTKNAYEPVEQRTPVCIPRLMVILFSYFSK